MVLERGAGSQKPGIRWRDERNSRWAARLNRAATRLADEIVGDTGEVGVLLRRGAGKDEGQFALEFVPFPHPQATKLRHVNHRLSTVFTAGPLIRWKPQGSSLLIREGNLLIGWLRGHEMAENRPRKR
jgi:hypothetical protein